MSELELQFLPADVLGLAPAARRLLAARPIDPDLPEILAPRDAADLAPPPDRLAPDEHVRLAERLEERLAALAPPVAVLDRVRALRRPGASIVLARTTPRFLGGTLAQLYLALGAVRLADELARAWSAPVVPVLWIDEVPEPSGDPAAAAPREAPLFLNENLELTRVALTEQGERDDTGDDSGGRDTRSPFATPLSAATHRLGAVRAMLRELLWKGPHQRDAVERFLPQEGESLGRAFARALSDLVGHRGLVVVEPDWLRDETSRALARVVGADPRAALDEGLRALERGAPELLPAADAALAAGLVLDRGPGADRAGTRPPWRALTRGGEGFRYAGEPGSRTPAELAAEIVQEPERWTAGPALRPAVLEQVLPVAGHVARWSELGVHSLVGPLRRELGLRRPGFVPAPACTLVEPELERALARLGLTLEAALRERAGAGAHGGPASEPPRAGGEGAAPGTRGTPGAATLRAAAERAATELRAAIPHVAAVDRGLALQLRRDAGRTRELIEKLAKKLQRVERNRAGKGGRHHRRLDGALFPAGRPQEEGLGTLAFVARHGTAWIELLAEELEAFPCEHHVLRWSAATPDEPDRAPRAES